MVRPIAKTIPWKIKSSICKTLNSGLDMVFESSSFLSSIFLGFMWSPACNNPMIEICILSELKYLLIFQNMAIQNISPNAFLLNDPTNIIFPQNFSTDMKHWCRLFSIKVIIKTLSNWHDHWQLGKFFLFKNMYF